MIYAAFLLAALLALPSSAQATENPRAFTAADPALRLVEHDRTGKKSYLTVWRGQLELTGLLVVEFNRGGDDAERDKTGSAFFEPDEASLRRLPAATVFRPRRPTVLWLPQSPRQLLMPLIGKKAFASVVNGKFGRYTYPAEITITEFSTSIECDHRNYSAKIANTRLLPLQRLAVLEERNLGC